MNDVRPRSDGLLTLAGRSVSNQVPAILPAIWQTGLTSRMFIISIVELWQVADRSVHQRVIIWKVNSVARPGRDAL